MLLTGVRWYFMKLVRLDYLDGKSQYHRHWDEPDESLCLVRLDSNAAFGEWRVFSRTGRKDYLGVPIYKQSLT